MWAYSILVFFLLETVGATPTGNHTCTGVVKHEVTVKVNVTEPVTFRAYEWCLRVPPRCSTYTIQLKDRVKIHKELHNRTITVCCKGYVEIDYKCVPACPPETECPNMHCNRTNHCYCTPGYTGLYCDHPCAKGYWGAGCIKECDCPTGYTCHHLTGDCMLDDSPPPKTRKTTTRAAAEEVTTPPHVTFPTTTPTTTPPTTTTPTTTPPTTTTPTTTPPTTTTPTTTPPTTTTPTTTLPTTTTTTPTTTIFTTLVPTTTPTTTLLATPTTAVPTSTMPTTISTTSLATTPSATFPTVPTTIPTTTLPTTTTIPTTLSTLATTNPTTTAPSTTVLTEQTFKMQSPAPPTTTDTTTINTSSTQPSSQPTTTTETVATTTEKTAFTTTTNTIPEPTTSATEQPTEPTRPPVTTQRTTVIQTTATPVTIASTTTTERPSTLLPSTTARTDPTTLPTMATSISAEKETVAPDQLGDFKVAVDTSSFEQLITRATPATHPPTTTVVLTTEATTVEPQTAKSETPTTTAPITTSSTDLTTLITELPSFTFKSDLSTEGSIDKVKIDPNTIWSNQLHTVWQNLTNIPMPSINPIIPAVPEKPSTSPTVSIPTTETSPATIARTTPSTVAPVTKILDFIPIVAHPAPTQFYTEEPVTQPKYQKSPPPTRIPDFKSEMTTSVPNFGYFDSQQPSERFPTGDSLGDISNRKPTHLSSGDSKSTTDRLDRLIVEDVQQPRPTTDTSPIKLVEEVISKYFPELKPRNEASEKSSKNDELSPGTDSPTEVGVQLANFQSVVDQSKKAQVLEKQDLDKLKIAKVASSFSVSPHQKETATISTTSTPSPSSTPKLSTIPVITPRVIVSAKNPDEIDLGGVIYRKMKLFPPAKPQKEFKPIPPIPPQAADILKIPPTEKPSASVSSGERFKLYLPEFGKALEKDDDPSSSESLVKTFLPKFNFDKEETDFNKQQYQSKKSKPKEKDLKKYKSKTYEFAGAPTSAEDIPNERVTNNVFLETKEFKVHLTSTKPQKFESSLTKTPFEIDEVADKSFLKKVNKKEHSSQGEEMSLARFPKFTEAQHRATVPLPSEAITSVEELQQPTTNPKPPHTWYSHAREKAKIKSALKVFKSTTLDMNNDKPPTEDPLGILDESNDINSLVTHDHHNGEDRYSSEREARSAAAAVTYQDDLNNPLMLRGQVNFNAESLASSSWIAQDGSMLGSTVAVMVAVSGATMLILTVAVALWLRTRSRGGQEGSEDGAADGSSSASTADLPPQHYETLYPLTHPAEEMEVATFFCPTFTNHYAERINKEFSELSYDHPRNSFEPLYAEILHPKMKDTE